MPSLMDIVPVTKTLKVGDNEFHIRGVSTRSLVYLFSRFPELKMMLSEDGLARERLIELAPDAIGAVIADALGKTGNEQEELAASYLPLEIQMDFLEAIGEATFRKGYAPFLARLGFLNATAPANPVPENTIREQPLKSEPLSNSSSIKEDSPPTSSGRIRRASLQAG